MIGAIVIIGVWIEFKIEKFWAGEEMDNDAPHSTGGRIQGKRVICGTTLKESKV
jgi:hypothetical protein